MFAQILSFVQNNYVDQVDEELLMHDAMQGLLKSLDPHSVYMTPSEYQKTQEDTSGAYGGLGIVISEIDDKGFVVSKVTTDSPAAHAGLAPGDRLLAVDGEPVEGLSLRNLSIKIRGLPDTSLNLRVVTRMVQKSRHSSHSKTGPNRFRKRSEIANRFWLHKDSLIPRENGIRGEDKSQSTSKRKQKTAKGSHHRS